MSIETYDKAVHFSRWYCQQYKDHIKCDNLEIAKFLIKFLTGAQFKNRPAFISEIFENKKAEHPDIAQQNPWIFLSIVMRYVAIRSGKQGGRYRIEQDLTFTGERSEDLIKRAKEDKLTYMATCELAADILAEGRLLPEPLANFTIGVLNNNIKVPQSKGRNPYEYSIRNFHIYRAVAALKCAGYRPVTRNDASSSKSACDAVIEGLKSIDTYLDFQTIKKIYNFRKKQYSKNTPSEINPLKI